MMPIPPAISCGGNSSRMIPKPSGNTPPAAPCSTRPAIITASDEAIADTTVPTANTVIRITSTRFLPYMSPSRPPIGVMTDALSRNAVSTQLPLPGEMCSDCSISGNAGSTSDWSTL